MENKPDKGKGKLHDYDDQGDSYSSEKDAVDDQESESDDDPSGTILPHKGILEEGDDETLSNPSSATEKNESQSQEISSDDQDAEEPGSRKEHECFSKVLSRFEVNPHNPALFISISQASEMIDGPQIEDDFPPGTYKRSIVVYDPLDIRYDMVLEHYQADGSLKFSITGGWEDFVGINQLRAGDEITVYRDVDADIVPDFFYYVIKYKRRTKSDASKSKSDDPCGTILPLERDREANDETLPNASSASDMTEKNESENQEISSDQTNQNVQGPGSRTHEEEHECFSKVLTRFEVIPHNPTLLIGIYQASEMIDRPQIEDDFPPGTYRRSIVVYDPLDIRYEMVLAHHQTAGSLMFSITGGWEDFVRINQLRPGDEITVYRHVDADIVPDFFYYVITYKRRPKSDVSKSSLQLRRKASGAGKKDPKKSRIA